MKGKHLILLLIAIIVPFGSIIAYFIHIYMQKTLKSPLKKWFITSKFGIRNGVLHNGVDLRAAILTPVYSPANGVILDKWFDDINGYGLKIKHENGLITGYAHLSYYTLDLKEGQFVKEGELVAHTGNTGHSTGPHLHFTVTKDGKKVNPVLYVKV